MWPGKKFTLKFYLKQPEYIRHDYKLLKKKGLTELANRLLLLSEGVLRFEISFRKESLEYLFKKKNLMYIDLLDKTLLERILAEYLNKLLLHFDKRVMEDKEVIDLLKAKYPKSKAIRLFTFYTLFMSQQLNRRQILIHQYNPSTIWRNKKDIAEAGVGLPKRNLKIFTLNIPSELVVNEDES